MKITKEYINEDGTPFTREEFINRIKSDDEFAKKWGELGPIYGKQWRRWGSHIQYASTRHGEETVHVKGIDQIQNLINDLKSNPDSRRLMVSAWNVDFIDDMVLPPCHYGFQLYTRELTWEEKVKWVMQNTDVELENLYIVEEANKETTPIRAISLMWNQRSVDTPLGLPFNIASYGLLLEIIAKIVNMVPDELIGNLGDTHIYLNQVDGVKEQIQREPYKLPKLKFSDHFDKILKRYTGETRAYGSVDFGYYNKLDALIESLSTEDFLIDGYKSHPKIHFPLSN